MAGESLLNLFIMVGEHINNRGSVAGGYVAVLVAALVLYIVSCAPDFVWQDSGMIQYRVWHNDIEGKLGLALSHPLFYVLAIGAKYIPLGEFAYRVNLVSASAAAVVVANLYLFLRLWLGKTLPAIIGAVTFAFSHTFWRHGSFAETYTLYVVFFLTGLIMLLQYVRTERLVYLYGLACFNGLAISVHMFASIPFLCYLVFVLFLLVRKRIRPKHLCLAAVFWFIGAGLYLYLIASAMVQSGDVLATLASAAFGGRYKGDVLNFSLGFRIIKENIMYVILNFPTPNIVLFFVGCYGISKLSPTRSLRNVLLALTILFFLFAFRYTVVDRYAFFIPFYCLASILVGVGSHFLSVKVRGKGLLYFVLVLAFLPVGVYAAVPSLAKGMGLNMGTRRVIPYRDEYKYFLQPWRTGYHGASQFASEALESVEQSAAIYADGTTVYPLLCVQQVKAKRIDVRILSDTNLGQSPMLLNESLAAELVAGPGLYVVSPVKHYCPDFLLEAYDFVESGILWKVIEKE